MKSIKKILIVLVLLVCSAVAGKNVAVNSYRINKGKVEILSYDSLGSDRVELKRVNSMASEISESGEFRITDKDRRSLVVTLNNGLIDGKYSEYYADGSIFTTGRYSDGKREGEWKIYTEDGRVWKTYNYKNDLLNGEHVIYHTKTSIPETKGSYVNGEKDGVWENFYLSGKRRMRGTYVEGLKNGLFTEWYESGTEKSRTNYVNDMMSGKMTVYYETGAVLYEADMNDRNGEIKGYYRNGTLSFEGKMKDGRRTGKWTFYDKSGNVQTQRNY